MDQIRLVNIAVKYGDNTVVKDFSLTVKQGECFTILGPGACGKTTLLRAISGFEKVAEGEIFISEQLVSSQPQKVTMAPEKRNIGVVFQDYAVWPHLTAYENVFYPLKKRKVEKKTANERALNALKQVRMSAYADRLPYQLSGGQQQRIALARALVSSSQIMLLDEPLCNLDANLREEMRFEIKELQRKTGMTIVYVSHDQDVALAISDRMAVLDKSANIRQIGAPEEVYNNPVDSYVYRFLGVSNFIPLEISEGRLYLHDSTESQVFPLPVPAGTSKKEIFAACRPTDIKLTREGKFKGVVKRVIFLGNIYEYRVHVGKHEIRVQQDAFAAVNQGMFKEEDACGLEFDNLRFYGDMEVV